MAGRFLFIKIYPSKFLMASSLSSNTKPLYNKQESYNRPGDAPTMMTRQDYIDDIIRLLEKADFRKLRLVWVYAINLLG